MHLHTYGWLLKSLRQTVAGLTVPGLSLSAVISFIYLFIYFHRGSQHFRNQPNWPSIHGKPCTVVAAINYTSGNEIWRHEHALSKCGVNSALYYIIIYYNSGHWHWQCRFCDAKDNGPQWVLPPGLIFGLRHASSACGAVCRPRRLSVEAKGQACERCARADPNTGSNSSQWVWKFTTRLSPELSQETDAQEGKGSYRRTMMQFVRFVWWKKYKK